jgi:hypothetical protein
MAHVLGASVVAALAQSLHFIKQPHSANTARLSGSWEAGGQWFYQLLRAICVRPF